MEDWKFAWDYLYIGFDYLLFEYDILMIPKRIYCRYDYWVKLFYCISSIQLLIKNHGFVCQWLLM